MRVTEARLWRIAKRFVSRLVWNEKPLAAVAVAAANPPPAILPFQPPILIYELVTEENLYQNPPRNFATREAVLTAFAYAVQHIGGRLPLCPSNYGKGRWGRDDGFRKS
jgi:hypothetical protein